MYARAHTLAYTYVWWLAYACVWQARTQRPLPGAWFVAHTPDALRGICVQCVMDELVLPDAPILDYNTRYSGITAPILEHVTTRRPEILARLRALLPPTATLVGHSLDNDFKSLKFVHGRVIDTVHLFPHPAGLPRRSALRVLTDRCAAHDGGLLCALQSAVQHTFRRALRQRRDSALSTLSQDFSRSVPMRRKLTVPAV